MQVLSVCYSLWLGPGAGRSCVFPDHHQCFPHAVVIPVGSKGTVHYHLAGPPFTSGSSLIMDLDVSEHWISVPCAPQASFSTTKWMGCADELF